MAIIVSDDFPGLSDAIKALYPFTEHQLFYVHLQRNVWRNIAKEDAALFNRELDSIKLSKDYDEGKAKLGDLCSQYKNRYPTFIKSLSSKIESYLCFLRYP